jgi:putative ABC transport system permease protein
MVLAISGGTQAYIGTMQSDTLSVFPISILPSTSLDRNFSDNYQQYLQNQYTFPSEDVLYPYDRLLDSALHLNTIDADYLTYLNGLNPEWYSDIAYNYGVTANMIVQTDLLEYSGEYRSISWNIALALI